MNKTIENYYKRRDARKTVQENYDAVEAFRQRRVNRLNKRMRSDAGIGYIFGMAKEYGIDTKGMEVGEVFEAVNNYRKEHGIEDKSSGSGNSKGLEKSKSSERSKGSDKSSAKSKGTATSKAVTPLKARMAKVSAKTAKADSSANKMSKSIYENGKKKANEYKELESYTDHHKFHIEQVCEKSIQAMDVMNSSKLPDGYGKIDETEILVAARLHDTGMDGDTSKDYANGNALRKDHPINSAMHVLENRAGIEKDGVDADRVALYVLGHSKSTSGIKDIMDESQWGKALDKIDEYVNIHNSKCAESDKIHFDKSKFITSEKTNADGSKSYVFDQDALATARSTVAALRIGDANRDAPEGDENITQSGAKIFCEGKYDSSATDMFQEIKSIHAGYTFPDGTTKICGEGDCDKDGFSRIAYMGEGNLKSINCVSDNGSVCEEFEIRDGSVYPYCTINAIEERIGEMTTMTEIPRSITIKLGNVPDSIREIYKYKMNRAEYADENKGISIKIV